MGNVNLMEIKARVCGQTVWVVCPFCERGFDVAVQPQHLKGKITCKCKNQFRVLFVRRVCERKLLYESGRLWIDKNESFPIVITDISLFGVGFNAPLSILRKGKQYDIEFSSQHRDVYTSVEVVRTQGNLYGARCVFPHEYSEAERTLSKIFEKTSA